MSNASTCPLCDHEGQPLFAKAGCWIQGCPACGHQWTEVADLSEHVRRVYSDAYFQGEPGNLAGYPDYLDEGPLLTARGRWYGRLLRKYARPGTLLDVGAAAGFMLKGLTRSGWRGVGVEPNETMASYARDTLGLQVHTATLEEFQSQQSFDLISMIQVLAHFPDPCQALRRAAELTRPGGFWLIETWDRASWSAWLFGRHWHEYSPPSVLHWYSAASLRRFASRFGFRQVAAGRPHKCLSGEHARALLRSQSSRLPFGQVIQRVSTLIPARVAVPYLADDLFWMLLRGPP